MRNSAWLILVIVICLAAWAYKKNPDGCAKLGTDVVHDTTIIFSGTNVPPADAAVASTPVVAPTPAPGAVAIVQPSAPSAPAPLPVIAPVSVAPVDHTPAPQSMPEFANDYDSALAAAKKANAPLLILFTGSDWCPYGQKLEQEVLSTPDFQKYRTAHYVFLKVDDLRNTPVAAADKQKITQLEQKFNVQGFPTLIMIDGAENEKGRVEGYNPGSGVAVVTAQLDKFATR